MPAAIDLNAEVAALDKLRQKLAKVFPGYITHIRFPRYKNMATDARINFDFPITALVGSNGSGKTSVLNALYGAPDGYSTRDFWFSTEVDPIEEGKGSPNRFIYGHHRRDTLDVVETRKSRVRKKRNGRVDPNYWEPTKEVSSDGMTLIDATAGAGIEGRSSDRWNPVRRDVLYINFRKELSAFDKYFYFGKSPGGAGAKKPAPKVLKGQKLRGYARIDSKMDQVQHDAKLLARVIQTGDTSPLFRNRAIASENRLLTAAELDIVGFILGRTYIEARWIKHRLFKGEDGVSVVFKTDHGRYSEAFAGSGEVAVTSCVVQVLAAAKGTLILLDEPEVSLHPGAQERLLAFLAQAARRNQCQIVFSTHSPHLVAALPDDAIKAFHQLENGAFAVLPATHPYAAFRRLGAVGGNQVRVLVEDRLAKSVVEIALSLIDDEATRALFRVEFAPGGASGLLAKIPTLMEDADHTLLLLDGDQRKVDTIRDPNTIPAAEDATLGAVILANVGIEPKIQTDSGTNAKAQEIAAQRRYLAWTRDHLRYLPSHSPEQIVLGAANKLTPGDMGNAQRCKARLHELASENFGNEASNETTDQFGAFLLGQNRHTSVDLHAIATQLTDFLGSLG